MCGKQNVLYLSKVRNIGCRLSLLELVRGFEPLAY